MILAINYADKPYKKAQRYNTKTAYRDGKVDKVISYNPEDISKEYREEHAYAFVLNDGRVGRFGLWRPRILKDAYGRLQEGDFVVYSDSGAYYCDDVHLLIDVMNRDSINIMVFEDGNKEKLLTKRDVFVYLDADSPMYTESNQRISGFFILRKSRQAEEFVEKFYRLTEEAPFLFTDEENKLGKDNYGGFIDHRHNQSVLSILTKKMGIISYRDPSEWGIYRQLEADEKKLTDDVLARSTFPRIFCCHRQKTMNGWKRRKLEAEIMLEMKKIEDRINSK